MKCPESAATYKLMILIKKKKINIGFKSLFEKFNFVLDEFQVTLTHVRPN